MAQEFHHTNAGNLSGDSPLTSNVAKSPSWKTISVETLSMDGFEWEILCDERWLDPVNKSYECHRITRRCKAMGGQLYSTSTHITPLQSGRPAGSPSVSESLIWGPNINSDDS